jgi:hypothetical protein
MLKRSAGKYSWVEQEGRSCDGDLDSGPIGNLFEQSKQIYLILAESDMDILRAYPIYSDGFAAEDRQQQPLAQVAM